MEIDAAFGYAFLDIEVAFEIMVFCLFRDFSKTAHSNRDFGFGSPMQEAAGGNKTDMDAAEIDSGGTGRGIEVRRRVKTRIGKICGIVERAAREIGSVVEARVRTKWILKMQVRGYGVAT